MRRWLLLLLVLAVFAAGCGDDDDSAEGGGGTVVEDEPAEEPAEEPADEPAEEPDEEPDDMGGYNPVGELKAAIRFAVNTLNPHDDQTPATFGYYGWIYEGLVRQDYDGSFVPWLAEGWEVSDDGLTITFTLHEGVTFHDGAPFNAEAVKANIDFVKTAEPDQVIPPVAGQMANVTEVEVIDEYTVAFHLAVPGEIILIAWLGRNSGLMVSPNSLGSAAENPIGTGPYMYNADESAADLTTVVYDANPNYWRPADVGVERVEMTVVSDNNARRQAFEDGQYDMIADFLAGGPPSVGRSIIGNGTIISFTVVDWLGERIPELANKDIRCAMFQAFNREGLTAQNNQSPESNRNQYAGAPGDYAYIEDLDVPSFDIEAAKAAYEAAGGQGFSFSNGYLPGTQFEPGSVGWAGGLNELGITMNNEPLDPPTGGEMFGSFVAGKYEIQTIPINEPHPLMTLVQRATADGTLNPTKAVPEGVEELVQAAVLQSNEDAEDEIIAAWKIMLEECIWMPWMVLEDGWEVQDYVTGVERVQGIPVGTWPQGIRVDG